MQLDDTTYLERFARRDLGPGPEHFDHGGHLRMARLHRQRYGLAEGNECVCAGIRDLATRFGAPEKYHRTLTEAMMRGVLARHYSDEVLYSAQARAGWVAPDLAPIQ